MVLSEILGIFHPPMNGRIPRSGSRSVSGGNRVGVLFDESSEGAAFRRWQNEEFHEIERQFAAGWRAALNANDLPQIATALRASGLTPQSCRSLPDAKLLAEQLIHAADKAFERLRFAVEFFDIGQQH